VSAVPALAYLLSTLAALLDLAWPGVLPGASRSALVLLVWLSLAPVPLPQAALRSGPAGEAGSLALRFLAVLPPLGLALGTDLARGRPGGWSGVLGGLALLALWCGCAQLARRSARARSHFALAWLLLLPGLAALGLALNWAGRGPQAGQPRFAGLFAVDPLVWIHGWGRAAASAVPPARVEPPWAALLVAVGLLLWLARCAPRAGAAEARQGEPAGAPEELP